jgi:hypothetical protein
VFGLVAKHFLVFAFGLFASFAFVLLLSSQSRLLSSRFRRFLPPFGRFAGFAFVDSLFGSPFPCFAFCGAFSDGHFGFFLAEGFLGLVFDFENDRAAAAAA